MLESGHLSAAALDVHHNEPVMKGKGPLGALDVPTLINTPHMAWYAPEARIEMRRKGAIAAKKALEGFKLKNVVNKEFM